MNKSSQKQKINKNLFYENQSLEYYNSTKLILKISKEFVVQKSNFCDGCDPIFMKLFALKIIRLYD
jgi:hypothetical protein